MSPSASVVRSIRGSGSGACRIGRAGDAPRFEMKARRFNKTERLVGLECRALAPRDVVGWLCVAIPFRRSPSSSCARSAPGTAGRGCRRSGTATRISSSRRSRCCSGRGLRACRSILPRASRRRRRARGHCGPWLLAVPSPSTANRGTSPREYLPLVLGLTMLNPPTVIYFYRWPSRCQRCPLTSRVGRVRGRSVPLVISHGRSFLAVVGANAPWPPDGRGCSASRGRRAR